MVGMSTYSCLELLHLLDALLECAQGLVVVAVLVDFDLHHGVVEESELPLLAARHLVPLLPRPTRHSRSAIRISLYSAWPRSGVSSLAIALLMGSL